MSNDIFVLVEHRDGSVTEGTFEILGRARELAARRAARRSRFSSPPTPARSPSSSVGRRSSPIEDPALAEFSPSAYQAALAPIVTARQPMLVLAANSGVGMDVAGGLSGVVGLPLAAFATSVAFEDGAPVITCQLYAGKIEARVRFRDGRGICTVVAGSYPASAGRAAGSPRVERSPCLPPTARPLPPAHPAGGW